MSLAETLRQLVITYGLAAILDAIGDEFPQYANDLHDVAEKAARDAGRLKK